MADLGLELFVVGFCSLRPALWISAVCDEALLKRGGEGYLYSGVHDHPLRMLAPSYGWRLYSGFKNTLALPKSLDSVVVEGLTGLWCDCKRMSSLAWAFSSLGSMMFFPSFPQNTSLMALYTEKVLRKSFWSLPRIDGVLQLGNSRSTSSL